MSATAASTSQQTALAPFLLPKPFDSGEDLTAALSRDRKLSDRVGAKEKFYVGTGPNLPAVLVNASLLLKVSYAGTIGQFVTLEGGEVALNTEVLKVITDYNNLIYTTSRRVRSCFFNVFEGYEVLYSAYEDCTNGNSTTSLESLEKVSAIASAMKELFSETHTELEDLAKRVTKLGGSLNTKKDEAIRDTAKALAEKEQLEIAKKGLDEEEKALKEDIEKFEKAEEKYATTVKDLQSSINKLSFFSTFLRPFTAAIEKGADVLLSALYKKTEDGKKDKGQFTQMFEEFSGLTKKASEAIADVQKKVSDKEEEIAKEQNDNDRAAKEEELKKLKEDLKSKQEESDGLSKTFTQIEAIVEQSRTTLDAQLKAIQALQQSVWKRKTELSEKKYKTLYDNTQTVRAIQDAVQRGDKFGKAAKSLELANRAIQAVGIAFDDAGTFWSNLVVISEKLKKSAKDIKSDSKMAEKIETLGLTWLAVSKVTWSTCQDFEAKIKPSIASVLSNLPSQKEAEALLKNADDIFKKANEGLQPRAEELVSTPALT